MAAGEKVHQSGLLTARGCNVRGRRSELTADSEKRWRGGER